jgi:MFS family permease
MPSHTETLTDPRRRGAVLRVIVLSLMLVVSAVASLNVALPEIARDTGASQSELQWIVDAYALVFAALLLPAGAIGDRFGRRTVLAVGIGLFGAASLGALFSSSAGQLIGLRALMGVGAACIMPVTLSVITTVFPPEERGKAVGTWVGVAAGGAIVGLLASGVMLEFFSWQSIFALNVVLAAAALVGTLVVVPATRDAHPPRLDPVGALLSFAGLTALVFGIIEGSERGWTDALTAGSLVAGVLGLMAFVAWELRRDQPMLDPRNFLRRGFGAGSASLTIQFFAMFGFLFLALPYLQLVQGFSPLEAACALLPMAVVVMPLSRKAPAIAARAGVRVTGAIGLSLMATGSSWQASCRSAPESRWPARPRPRPSWPRCRERSRASPLQSTTSPASSAALSVSPSSAAFRTRSTDPTSPTRPRHCRLLLPARPNRRSRRHSRSVNAWGPAATTSCCTPRPRS